MKRFIAILLAVVLIAGVLPAYAAAEWKCDKCDTINDGKFCGECGSPKPVWKCSECSKENTTKYCSNCGIPKEYSDGSHALNNEEFEKAAEIFSSLDYGDSKVMQIMAIGQWGVQLWEQKQYDDAVEKAEYVFDLFMRAAAHDSTFLTENDILYLEMCVFSFFAYSSAGAEACEEGYLGYAIHMYEQAYSFLEQIPSEDLEEFGGRNELFYGYAEWLMQVQSYELAAKWFGKCDDYLDSASKVAECRIAKKEADYAAAVALKEDGKYEDAITAFEAMGGYKDSAEQILSCQAAIKEREYTLAVSLKTARQYEKAIAAFEAMNGYKDSAEQITDCKYLRAIQQLSLGNDTDAFDLFLELRPYKNSETYLGQFKFIKASETNGSAQYTYNKQGLLVEQKDSHYKYSWQYNSQNQKISLHAIFYDGRGTNTTTTYSYDQNGNLVSVRETGAFGKYDDTVEEREEYFYDLQNRKIKSIRTIVEEERNRRSTKGDTTIYRYDENSQLVAEFELEYGWGLFLNDLSITIYEYNEGGLLIKETVYVYDGAYHDKEFNALDEMKWPEQLQATGKDYYVDEIYEYEYDEQGRLLVKKFDYCSNEYDWKNDYTHVYEYDADGNIVSDEYTTPDKTSLTTYVYENGKLKEESAEKYTIIYSYDEFGNLIEKAYSTGTVWTYTYWPVYSNE